MYCYLDNAHDEVDGEVGVGAFGIVEVAAVEEARWTVQSFEGGNRLNSVEESSNENLRSWFDNWNKTRL